MHQPCPPCHASAYWAACQHYLYIYNITPTQLRMLRFRCYFSNTRTAVSAMPPVGMSLIMRQCIYLSSTSPSRGAVCVVSAMEFITSATSEDLSMDATEFDTRLQEARDELAKAGLSSGPSGSR